MRDISPDKRLDLLFGDVDAIVGLIEGNHLIGEDLIVDWFARFDLLGDVVLVMSE